MTSAGDQDRQHRKERYTQRLIPRDSFTLPLPAGVEEFDYISPLDEMSAEDAQFYIRDGWIELAE
jgi:hypothetical protein